MTTDFFKIKATDRDIHWCTNSEECHGPIKNPSKAKRDRLNKAAATITFLSVHHDLDYCKTTLGTGSRQRKSKGGSSKSRSGAIRFIL